jgi:hypothetical protein
LNKNAPTEITRPRNKPKKVRTALLKQKVKGSLQRFLINRILETKKGKPELRILSSNPMVFFSFPPQNT